jgi:hypothetical protein
MMQLEHPAHAQSDSQALGSGVAPMKIATAGK